MPRIFVESDYTYLEPIFDVLADKIARYSMTRTAFLKAQIVIETMAMIFEWEAEGYSDSAPAKMDAISTCRISIKSGLRDGTRMSMG